MTIKPLPEGAFEFKEVFNSLLLKTAAGEQFSICMRDTGFEFYYQGRLFEAKKGFLGPARTSIDQTKKERISCSVTDSRNIANNTQCIILLTQIFQLQDQKMDAVLKGLDISTKSLNEVIKKRIELITNFLSSSSLPEDLSNKTSTAELKSSVVYVDTREEFATLYAALYVPYKNSKPPGFMGTSLHANTFSTDIITVTIKTK